MDKAEQILAQHKEANDFLVSDANFEPTSSHPSWQGKIKCRYCKARGWPMRVSSAKWWWGNKHGYDCKWKELWILKQRQALQNSVTITYGSTNTNWAGNWYVSSTGNAFFGGKI